MYTWMEIRQSCAWIDTGYFAELSVNVASILSATSSPNAKESIQGMRSGSRRFVHERIVQAAQGIFNLGKPAQEACCAIYGALLCHVVLRKQPANLRFWCRQSQLTFRSMKSTVIHGPSPNSLISKHHFFRCYGWWTNVCTTKHCFRDFTYFLMLSINSKLFVFMYSDLARPWRATMLLQKRLMRVWQSSKFWAQRVTDAFFCGEASRSYFGR